MAVEIDPIRNFRFVLEIPEFGDMEFSDVSGFNATTDVIEYRTGGDKQVRKFPGTTKYGNITLKRATTDNAKMFQWFKTCVENGLHEADKLTGSIKAYDYHSNEELAQWDFEKAWPIKYTAPDFTAKGNDVAVEQLELVCERLIRAK